MSIKLLLLELWQILLIRDLSRNTEIEIGAFWVLSNILRLEQVRDMYVSNTKVLQCYKMSGLQLVTFLSYHKKLRGKGEYPPPLPRLWLKKFVEKNLFSKIFILLYTLLFNYVFITWILFFLTSFFVFCFFFFLQGEGSLPQLS